MYFNTYALNNEISGFQIRSVETTIDLICSFSRESQTKYSSYHFYKIKNLIVLLALKLEIGLVVTFNIQVVIVKVELISL